MGINENGNKTEHNFSCLKKSEKYVSSRRRGTKENRGFGPNICNSNDLQNIEDTLNEYDALKAGVNTIYEQKGKAAMFRSKFRWIEKGERPTKYFFNLEKQNYKRKTITELRLEDEKILFEENGILKSMEDFYYNLYKSKGSLSEAEFHQFYE